jgi:tRNA-Thr(GGU) m(6)t(6)A37 methyltransferase TsaA
VVNHRAGACLGLAPSLSDACKAKTFPRLRPGELGVRGARWAGFFAFVRARNENNAVTDPVLIEPIGVVRSALRDRRHAPRQAFEGAPGAVLDISPELAPALHRVTPGSELIVVTWLHEADRGVLQVHPMDDERIPLTGVFATRSPDRPNPIGLHQVTVTGIAPPALVYVDALEAIDGTPILDLKVAISESADASRARP